MRPGPSTATSRSRPRGWRTRHRCQSNVALRKMAVADNTSPNVLGLEIGMLGEEIRDLGLYD